MKVDWKYGTVITNSRIPGWLSIFINIGAITLYPFMIFRGEVDEVTLNHERIHIVQQRELFVVIFYLLYVFFWIINLVRYRSSQLAYYNIPFEREAYANHSDFTYLLKRKKYSWVKRIWK